MTAERYELRADHTDWLDVRDPQGYRNTINQPGAIALIRQQARDITEWDRLFTAVVSQSLPNAPQLWPFDGEQGPAMVAFAIHQLRTDLAAAVARAEQAEARLAAIDSAPTVAVVRTDYTGNYIDRESKMPPIGTELIARPAKD